MNGFRKIDVKQLPGNIFSLFDSDWALITAGGADKWNTMTISWGACGWLWYKPVCMTFVRQSRYTLEFTEARDCFTVSFFDKDECREPLRELGSKSGRDMDKMHGSGLTPVQLENEVAFAEAKAVLVCRKLYADWISPDRFLDGEAQKRSYGETGGEDMHRMYVAEVSAAYIRE